MESLHVTAKCSRQDKFKLGSRWTIPVIGIYFSFVREASTSPSEACPTGHRCKLHHFGRSPRLLYSIYKAQTCAPKKSPRRRHKHTRLQCVHVEDQMLRQACDCQLLLLESIIWNDMNRKCVWMRLIQTCPPDHTIMPPGICPAAPLNGERPEQDALWYIKIMKFQCIQWGSVTVSDQAASAARASSWFLSGCHLRMRFCTRDVALWTKFEQIKKYPDIVIVWNRQVQAALKTRRRVSKSCMKTKCQVWDCSFCICWHRISSRTLHKTQRDSDWG